MDFETYNPLPASRWDLADTLFWLYVSLGLFCVFSLGRMALGTAGYVLSTVIGG